MTDSKHLPGKFVWFEHVSTDAKKAQAFFAEVLGWKTQPFPPPDGPYEMMLAGATIETMVGGYAAPQRGGPAHWIAYVSVPDVDAAARAATASGGKVIDPPQDLPGVGRSARIADPQGAELCVFKNLAGDPPDREHAPDGTFFWNELHTPDPVAAIAFYEKVVGWSGRGLEMGPAGTYYIVARDGVDRGGATSHMGGAEAPHWLPYVAVADPDATLARVAKHGGKVCVPAMDIPDIGRFGVLQDPTGAALAVMKPLPPKK